MAPTAQHCVKNRGPPAAKQPNILLTESARRLPINDVLLKPPNPQSSGPSRTIPMAPTAKHCVKNRGPPAAKQPNINNTQPGRRLAS